MPYRSIRLATISMVLILASSGTADAKNDKPKIAVAPDGFPTGLDTPEGAASDLERAYINHDSNLFANVCIGLYVNHTGPALYDKFMRETIARLDRESSSKTNRPKDAKAIAKVFAARHFSRNGPASYGYAGFDFLDVQFVNGTRIQRRRSPRFCAPGWTKRHPPQPIFPRSTRSANSSPGGRRLGPQVAANGQFRRIVNTWLLSPVYIHGSCFRSEMAAPWQRPSTCNSRSRIALP